MFVEYAIAQSCVSQPVSVDDITNCRNGVCSLDTIVTGHLDILTTRTNCIQLGIGGGDVLATVNVTLTNGYLSQPVEYCYYTSDVSADTTAACACDGELGGAWADCGLSGPGFGSYCNKAGNTKYNQHSFCDIARIVNDPGTCAANGQYCWNTAFYAYRRYKVCRLGPRGLMSATINVKTNGYDLYIPIDVKQGIYLTENNMLNFTTFGGTFEAGISEVKYLVVDLEKGEYMFFGDETNVNANNEYNFDKIGWYKVGQNKEVDEPELRRRVSVRKTECTKDQGKPYLSKFERSYNYLNVSTILDTYKQYRHTALAPDAFFFDQEWKTTQEKTRTFNQNNSGYWEVSNGFFGYEDEILSRMSFVGLGLRGNFVPATYYSLSYEKEMLMTSGLTQKAKWNMHCKQAWLSTGCGQVCIAEHKSVPGQYGFCFINSCGTENKEPTCGFIEFVARNWPSNQDVKYIVKSGLGMTIEYLPQQDNTKSTLFYPVKKVQTFFSLSVRNVTVKFISQDVRPVVTSCNGNDKGVNIKMKTDGADGAVVVSLSPGNYPSQIYYLTMEEKEYLYPVAKNASGSFTVLVRGYDGTEKCNVKLNISISNEFEKPNVTIGEGGGNSTGGTGNPFGFFDSIGKFFGGIFDFDTSSIWTYVIIAAIVIVIIIVVILLIVGFVFLFPYIAPLLSCCFTCCATSNKSRPSRTQAEEKEKLE